MATFSKVFLSASTQGKAIKVAQTASVGTAIHTTGTSTSVTDEVWLYAQNTDTTDRKLTIEWGAQNAPDDLIEVTIPAESGLVLVVPGLILKGDGATGAGVKAFAASANVVTVVGYVNRIS